MFLFLRNLPRQVSILSRPHEQNNTSTRQTADSFPATGDNSEDFSDTNCPSCRGCVHCGLYCRAADESCQQAWSQAAQWLFPQTSQLNWELCADSSQCRRCEYAVCIRTINHWLDS